MSAPITPESSVTPGFSRPFVRVPPAKARAYQEPVRKVEATASTTGASLLGHRR